MQMAPPIPAARPPKGAIDPSQDRGHAGASSGECRMAERRSGWSTVGKLALLTLLLTPVTILIHEFGHLVVPLVFGLPGQLHPGSVSGGAALGAQPAWMVALQAGGGPLMTVLMGAGGATLYRRDRHRLWALAFAAAAISRLLVSVAWLGVRLFLLVIGRPYGARPNFDEHALAQACGISPLVTALAAALVFFEIFYWLVRSIERGRRLIYVVTMA